MKLIFFDPDDQSKDLQKSTGKSLRNEKIEFISLKGRTGQNFVVIRRTDQVMVLNWNTLKFFIHFCVEKMKCWILAWSMRNFNIFSNEKEKELRERQKFLYLTVEWWKKCLLLSVKTHIIIQRKATKELNINVYFALDAMTLK